MSLSDVWLGLLRWLRRTEGVWSVEGRAPLALATVRDARAPMPRAAAARPLPVQASEAEAAALLRTRRRAAALAVFNPAQPVESRFDLLGREEELGQLRQAVLEMGMHGLIHGPRGAGKTSLARAFGDYADEQGDIVLYHACGSGGDFHGLFRPYLEDLAGALPPGPAARLHEALAPGGRTLDARALCALMAALEGQRIVLIVDEFDRVEEASVRAEVAALLKLLSDCRAPVRLLLVGIARDVTGLIDAHASLRRHLVSVGLRRFDEASVSDIFARGERATGITIPPEHRARIAALSAGSPYHLRLLCYSVMLATIDAGEPSVGVAAVQRGLRTAYDMWASSSPVASALFERLMAQGPAMQSRLCDFAVATLAADPAGGGVSSRPSGLTPVDLELFEMLSPALLSAEEGRLHQFEDSLAPQFLMIACFLAQSTAAPQAARGRNPAERIDDLRQEASS